MLSLDDIRHLDAAEGWLERGQYANCFDELERIDCDEREDGRVLAVRWKLYNQSGHHFSAANLTAGIQWDFPNEVAGCVWHVVSLTKLGCTEAETRINHQISGR